MLRPATPADIFKLATSNEQPEDEKPFTKRKLTPLSEFGISPLTSREASGEQLPLDTVQRLRSGPEATLPTFSPAASTTELDQQIPEPVIQESTRRLTPLQAYLNRESETDPDKNRDINRFVSGVNTVVVSAGQSVFEAFPKAIAIIGTAGGNFAYETFYGEEATASAVNTDLFKLGEQIGNDLESIFPQNPEFQDEFLTKLLTGAGQLGVTIASGGLGGPALAAGQAAANLSSNEYQQAIAAGKTEDEAFNTFLLNLPAGASEAIPVRKYLRRLDTVTGGGFKKILAKGLAGGIEEGVQELFEGIYTNSIAIATYDATRNLFGGVGSDALVGFILGNAVTSASIGINNKLQEVKTKQEVAKATTELREILKAGEEVQAYKEPGNVLPTPRTDWNLADQTVRMFEQFGGADANTYTQLRETFVRDGYTELIAKLDAAQERGAKAILGEIAQTEIEFDENVVTEEELNKVDPDVDIDAFNDIGAVANNLVRLKEDGEIKGIVAYDKQPEYNQIRLSDLDADLQGFKQGLKMYQALADKTLAEGKELYSDDSVSSKARRVYKALEARGYKLETNPDVRELAERDFREGESVATGEVTLRSDTGPVFKIVAAPEPYETKAISTSPPMSLEDLQKRTGAKWETLMRVRRSVGLEALPPKERGSALQAFENAIEKEIPKQALTLAGVIDVAPRPLSPEEMAGMVLKLAEEQKIYEENILDAHSNIGVNPAAAVRAQAFARGTQGNIDLLTTAINKSLTEAGRSLQAGQFAVNLETMTLDHIVRQTEIMQGEKLTPLQQEQFVGLYKKLKENNHKIEDLWGKSKKEQEQITRDIANEAVKKAIATTVVPTDPAAIDSEIALIKEQFKLLGFRVNDVGGLSSEASFLIAKLAKKYLQKSAQSMDSLVRKISADLPEVSNRDIIRGLTNLDEKVFKGVEQAVKDNLNIIKDQGKLLQQLEKQAAAGGDIKDILNKLNATIDPALIPDSKTLAKLDKIIASLRKKQGTLKPKFPDPDTKVSLEEQARLDEISDLRAILRIEQQTANLKHMLKTGIFKEPKRRSRRGAAERAIRPSPATQQLTEALIKQREIEATIFHKQAQVAKVQGAELAKELVRLPRALLATADMSGTLRQGLALSLLNPSMVPKAFITAGKATFSRREALTVDMALRSHPNQPIRDAQGLYLAPLRTGVSKSEEVFMTRLLDKMPIFDDIFGQDLTLLQQARKVPLALVSETMHASNRHMVTYLNMLRVGTFDQFLRANPEHASLHPTEVGKLFAQFVNEATGRGTLKPQTAEALSLVAFAPRFAISRFQTPFTTAKLFQHPETRKVAAKAMVNTVAFGTTVLGLALLSGAEVGHDPEESDFGKIIIGNTRIDIWGGFQQPASLIARMMTGSFTSHTDPQKSGQVDLFGLLESFSTYKLSPAITLPIEALGGKDVLGNDVTLAETIMSNTMPLFAQDAREIAEAEGLGTGILATGGTFFGVGAGQFESPLSDGRIKPLFKKADYTPRAPSYDNINKLSSTDRLEFPNLVGRFDSELKAELDLLFQSLVANQLLYRSRFLNSLSPATLRPILVEASAIAKEQMEPYTNVPLSPEFVKFSRQELQQNVPIQSRVPEVKEFFKNLGTP